MLNIIKNEMEGVFVDDAIYQEMGPAVVDNIVNALGEIMASIKNCGANGGSIPLFTSNVKIANQRCQWVKTNLLPLLQNVCEKSFHCKKIEYDIEMTSSIKCAFL